MSDLWRNIARKIIGQALKDLSDRSKPDYDTALAYVRSEKFTEHCSEAGYPAELRDAIDEMVQLSDIEKRYVLKEILTALKKSP